MFLRFLSHLTKCRAGYLTAIIMIIADQFTKLLIIEYLMIPPRIIYINEYFNLVLTWNNGISFGLFNNDSKFNALVISVIGIGIVLFLIGLLSRAETKKLKIGLGLIIGGAIGNIIDRGIYGAVMDFLDIHIGNYHWPAFNIADSCITIGAIILVIDSLFSQKQN